MRYAMLAAILIGTGLIGFGSTGTAAAQNYPSREPNDLIHGGAVENGVRHQPTQAEVEARARTTPGGSQVLSQEKAAGPEQDKLYNEIKQQQKISILNPPSQPANSQ